MSIQYRSGPLVTTLTGCDERWVRQTLEQALGGAVAVMEAEAEAQAQEAKGKWYTLVDKETGKSGEIVATTTLDIARSEVRVGLASLDTSKAGKAGKPRVVFIHAPRADSLVRVQVTPEVYWNTPKALRSNFHPLPPNAAKQFAGDPEGSGPFIWEKNPKASSGAFLLETLVKKPMRARIKKFAPEVGRQISARIQRS